MQGRVPGSVTQYLHQNATAVRKVTVRHAVRISILLIAPRSYRLDGPGHHSFKVETGDRSPVGVPDNVEVAEAASWAVTPTQRFESAPHPEGMAEQTCGGLQPRTHRCKSCCPLHLNRCGAAGQHSQGNAGCRSGHSYRRQNSGGNSAWSESLPWKQGAVGSNPTLQTNSKAPWLNGKGIRLIRGRQVVRLHPARPGFGC